MTDTASPSAALPLTRLHLTVQAGAPLQLPPYAGSMLRGAWGHALLALSTAPQYDFKTLVEQTEVIQLQAQDLRWFDWGRYSQRQQQEMQLGGLLGAVTLHGDLAPFAELLHLGQWLHVGKNATMGLGGYRLTAS